MHQVALLSSPPGAQASLQSPFPQEDSSGSQTFLVSVSNVWVRVDVRYVKGGTYIHHGLCCRVCAELTWEKGRFAFWRWNCCPSLADPPSHQAESLSRLVWCSTHAPWGRGVGFLQLMPSIPSFSLFVPVPWTEQLRAVISKWLSGGGRKKNTEQGREEAGRGQEASNNCCLVR